jgi:branched-chain amino acid transport system permease protein
LTRGTLRARTVAAVLIVAALALPAIVWNTPYRTYALHVAVQILAMGLYAMAWDLLNGYVGLFSFGHAAFFGIGAYVCGMAIVHGNIQSAPAAVGAAMIAATLAGGIVGFLAARVGRVAVFLVTFACAETMYLVALADPRGLTGGDNGLPGLVPARMLGLDLTTPATFYYVTLAIVALSYVALRAVVRSRFGRVLVAIRENERRARFAGFEIERYKMIAFAISACFAGIAGAVTALHQRLASPEMLTWAVSGDAVLYATLGGTGTLAGPILGAGLILVAREILSDVLRSWLIVVGCLYVALVVFLPSGIYPLVFRREPGAENT